MYYIPGLFRGKNKPSLTHGHSIPSFDPDSDCSSSRAIQSPTAHRFLPHPTECSLPTGWIVISETSIFHFLLVYFSFAFLPLEYFSFTLFTFKL
jgi:hypothetical protein